MRIGFFGGVLVLVALMAVGEHAYAQSSLVPFSKATSDKVPAPWRLAGLRKGKPPSAVFDIATIEDVKVLRLRTDKTYGASIFDINDFLPTSSTVLKWRWRLDEPVPHADLRRKSGDDAALKVCVLYDMSTELLPLSERVVLAVARALIDSGLPAAALCYVWDVTLPAGTLLNNAHTNRIKYWVLDGQGSEASLKTWKTHERHVGQDFLKAFGHESKSMAPVTAIVAAADSDSTKGSSLAYVGDIVLEP